MDHVKMMVVSGLVLAVASSAPRAWSQTAQTHAYDTAGSIGCASSSSAPESASLMDQKVSQDIRRAWSEGKNATAAMAFQENGEVAMSEGKERQAKQFFGRAERELETLEPGEPSE